MTTPDTQTMPCPMCRADCRLCLGNPVPVALIVEYNLLDLGPEYDGSVRFYEDYDAWCRAVGDLRERHGLWRGYANDT